ncbi:MAG: glycerol-3-phosphate 1-O-acyltransferase PlsY [Fimbriimonas sp.]|jgi:glycerol-3-phosphate acyltransferase PlsY|nr:glycerol-3-phosphate 1-O-acyltransferase PlsY [Fimbriimonas sp.]
MILVGLAIFAFLLGSIPFGMLLARAKGVDIRTVGSGNIGATNVVRALGPKVGLAVFVLDVLKGTIPALIATQVVQDPVGGVQIQTISMLMGVIAILGHMFSPFIGFKGGKGVATGFGAALGAIPGAALVGLAVISLTVALTRYVSLGSILAAISVPIVSMLVFRDSLQLLPILVVMAAFIIWKHRANIERLRNGTESKFAFKKQIPDKEEDDGRDPPR